jgi:hypothetical protein
LLAKQEAYKTKLAGYKHQAKSDKDESKALGVFRKTILSQIDKVEHALLGVESQLQCLSCSKALEQDFHTLRCCHSICATCYNTHADPTNLNSAVFCQDCSVDTKNRQMVCNHPFIRTLSSQTAVMRLCLS